MFFAEPWYQVPLLFNRGCQLLCTLVPGMAVVHNGYYSSVADSPCSHHSEQNNGESTRHGRIDGEGNQSDRIDPNSRQWQLTKQQSKCETPYLTVIDGDTYIPSIHDPAFYPRLPCGICHSESSYQCVECQCYTTGSPCLETSRPCPQFELVASFESRLVRRTLRRHCRAKRPLVNSPQLDRCHEPSADLTDKA